MHYNSRCLDSLFICYSEILQFLTVKCQEGEEGDRQRDGGRKRERENLHMSNCWCLSLMRSLANCAYAAVWELMVCLLSRRASILWTPAMLCKIGFWGRESGAECIPCSQSHTLSHSDRHFFLCVHTKLVGSDSGAKSSGFKVCVSAY